MNAASHSVKYEAATSLMALTHAPAAVKGMFIYCTLFIFWITSILTLSLYLNLINLAAASCYIELIIKKSDNNVKLIVLDRLDELRERHDQTLDDLVLDILCVLTRYS